MPDDNLLKTRHFTLELLTTGVCACVHRPGGGAYSNAGIIDLGGRTILVDALNTLAAGRDLRRIAEVLYERPVDTIILTHPHSDHWIGASAFDPSTIFLTTPTIRDVCMEWGAEIMKGYQDTAGWEAWLKATEEQLQSERDERVRAGLEKTITSIHYKLAEMDKFQPRYADQTFKDAVTFQGDQRKAELRSLGRGHSEEDVVLLLPDDGIAFIGDVGFFATQPFMGYCNIDLYRQQLRFFLEADYEVLVPGHGPVGNKDDVAQQLQYMDMLEALVGEVVQSGGSFDQALQVNLPAPFDEWLMGGMARFGSNIRYLFAYLGGEVPPDD